VGNGLTLVTVMLVLRWLVLVGKGLLLVDREFTAINFALVLMMPVLVSGKPRVLVLVRGMCVVVATSLEGVCLPMGTMSVLLGRSRALVHRVFCPRRGGSPRRGGIAPRVAHGLLAANGALTSPDTLTCS
jgi:hypothetical protein